MQQTAFCHAAVKLKKDRIFHTFYEEVFMNRIAEGIKHRRAADALTREHVQEIADETNAAVEKTEQAAARTERDPRVVRLRGELDKIRRTIAAAERGAGRLDTAPGVALLLALGTGDREQITTARRALRESLERQAENAALVAAGAAAIAKLQYSLDRALIQARRNIEA